MKPNNLLRSNGRYAGLLIVFGTSLAGCGPSMTVNSYWGPGMRFSDTAGTYDWVSGAGAGTVGADGTENPRLDALIKASVEKHLARKGYARARDADVWVDYRVARNVRADPYGGIEFPQHTEGSLGLYVINPEDSKLIWRGIVTTALDPAASPEERVKTLDIAVQKMLDELPSPKGGK